MTDQPKRSRFATDSIAAPLRHAGVPAHLARQPRLQPRDTDPGRRRGLGDDADDVVRRQGRAGADRADAADHADRDAGRRHRRHARPARRRAGLARDCAGRRNRADGAGVARPRDAEYPAGAVLRGRQRHGAVRAGLAGLGQRAGAGGNAAGGGRAQRHQLQHRAQLRAGDRRHRGRDRGRGGGVRRQCGAVSAADGGAVSVEPHPRTVAPAARTSQPRHRLGRALHRQLAVDPHRPDPDIGHRHDRRLGLGADAAGRPRPAAWRRANLRHHAGSLRHGRGVRRAQYRRGAPAHERRSRGARLRDIDGRRDRFGRPEHERHPDGGRPGARRGGVDAGGRAVQHRRAALGAALGRRAARWRLSRLRSPAASRWEAGAGDTSPTLPAWRSRCWFRPV